MSVSLPYAGLKQGDGLGDFMKFTSDSDRDDPPADNAEAGCGDARNVGPSQGPAARPLRFSGARSTGVH